MRKLKQVVHPQTPEISEPKPAEPQVVEKKRTSIQNPNAPAFYANGFQLAMGAMDVRLYLIETIPVSPVEIQDRVLAAIIMAPEALKLLADNIKDFADNYEKQFGKIRDVAKTPGLTVPHQE